MVANRNRVAVSYLAARIFGNWHRRVLFLFIHLRLVEAELT